MRLTTKLLTALGTLLLATIAMGQGQFSGGGGAGGGAACPAGQPMCTAATSMDNIGEGLIFNRDPSINAQYPIVLNGDFEAGFIENTTPPAGTVPGWFIAGSPVATTSFDTSTQYEGAASVIVTVANLAAGLTNNEVAVATAGNTYKLTAALKVNSGVSTAEVCLDFFIIGGGNDTNCVTNATGTWSLQSATITAPANTYAVGVFVGMTGAGTGEYDAISLIQTNVPQLFTGGNAVALCSSATPCTVSASGANTALSNLAAVSINTSLLFQTTVDLGSTANPARNLYLYGAGTYGTTYLELTGTPTSTRTWTFQDATDTVVGRATTDTFTNKTYITNSTGNAFTWALPGTISGGTSGGVLCETSTTAVTSSTLLATNAVVVGGGSGTCPSTGNGDLTYATHTFTMGASGILDMSATSATAGLKIPVAAGAIPTADGFIALNSTTHAMVHGSNGTTIVDAAAATGTNTSTTCTNQYVTVISSVAAPTCTSLTFPLTIASGVSGAIPYFSSTTVLSASALLAAHAIMQGGGAGTAPATGNADFTVDSTAHTLLSGASGLVDFSAITGAAGFKVPVGAGYAPTANGAMGYDSTAQSPVAADNGATVKRGGVLCVAVGEDALVGNVINQTETAFAETCTIPAGFLITNKLIRVSANFFYGASGSATQRIRIRWGGISGSILYDTGAVTPASGAANRGGMIFNILGGAAAGSSVTVGVGKVACHDEVSGSITTSHGMYCAGSTVGDSVSAVNTSSSASLVITVQYGTGATSSDTHELANFLVEAVD